MKTCKNCRKQNPDNAAYCLQCGAKLTPQEPVASICRRCGFSQNAPGSVYCGRCGKPLNAGKSQKGRKYLIPAIVIVLAIIIAAAMFLMGANGPTKSDDPLLPVTQPVLQTEATQEKPSAIPSPESTIPLQTTQPMPSETTAPPTPVVETVAVPKEKLPIAVDGGRSHSVVLYNDGTVATIGDDTYGQRSTSGWRDIIQISTFADHTLGLKADGTVVATGNNLQGQCNVSDWTNIVAVAAGSQHSVGVRSDGTVVAVGANNSGQCDVQDWQNIAAVAATNTSTFCLTTDGRILVCGSFYNRSLESWSDIVNISVSTNHVVGVHSDGTVSAIGANDQGQCDDMAKWRDTKQVAAGYGFTAGLRAKGSVWVHGADDQDQHSAMQWTNIVTLGTGTEHLLGIQSDGKLVAKGNNDAGQCDVGPLNRQLGK